MKKFPSKNRSQANIQRGDAYFLGTVMMAIIIGYIAIVLIFGIFIYLPKQQHLNQPIKQQVQNVSYS